MRHRLWGLLGLLGLALALTFPKSTLYVEGNGKRHLLKVEVADTPERWAQGLMFRERLGEDEGMVFLFPEPTAGGFWMKNTLIPLDMVFISEDWRVVGVIEDVPPLSEVSRTVGTPSRYVLEFAAGTMKSVGIGAGDRVTIEGNLPYPR